ncbi:uncharacterized protein LOC112083975 [Eutrema salsugineum]|uniref:uncharacterized protein LOC112083975 n=1 Tax=Eutrema salsugineum TaxID=72664 RepID=UPI000CED40BD|nr:uncharacterized protein LOC112083975 [Eutrema salsugineum]
MASYDHINDLHLDRTNWSLRVKVLKKWIDQGTPNRDSLQMMLMDEEGDMVQAYLYHAGLIKLYDREINEGDWKTIQDFVVFEDPLPEPNSPIGWSIQLLENTTITDTEPREVESGKGFYSFPEILKGEADSEFPVDLLGFVISTEELKVIKDQTCPNRPNKMTPSITFTMKDHNDMQIQCNVVGQLAVDFNNKIWDVRQIPALCLLTDWSIKNDGGNIYLKSRGGITRFEFHPELKVAESFCKMFWNNEKKSNKSKGAMKNDAETTSSSKKQKK